MDTKRIVNWVVLILVVVGGVNWGLVGLADFNLVTTIFGEGTVLTQVVYILVAVAAVWMLAAELMKSSEK